MNELIVRAVEILGSQSELARSCGVSQPTVHKWLHGLAVITPRNAIAVEHATGGKVTREQLCPDIFNVA